jgi:magnesium-transporting ATPase (P-type)
VSARRRLGEVDRSSTSSSVGDDLVRRAVLAKINRLSNDDALKILATGPSGLSRSEAQRRLVTYGANRIEQRRGESLLVSFLKQFIHFFALILWVAAALAFGAEWSAPGQGMAKVGVAITIVIVVSGVFSFWQEHRAEQTLAGLRRLLPQRADVLRDGKATELPIEELVPGDVVLLEQGDHIPADCRLIGPSVSRSIPRSSPVRPSPRYERPDRATPTRCCIAATARCAGGHLCAHRGGSEAPYRRGLEAARPRGGSDRRRRE